MHCHNKINCYIIQSCFINKESIEHLFCECPVSITLYMQIKEWCQEMHINFPEIIPSNILFGIILCSGDNILINNFILLFKQIFFYSRDKFCYPSVTPFKNKIKEREYIEQKIALKKKCIYDLCHCKKWAKYKKFLSKSNV